MRWSTYDAKRKCSLRDKCREVMGKGVTVEGSWVRWELEFKIDRANLCLNLLSYLPIVEWKRFIVG
jgi:DNA relaxase NicK